VLILGSSFAGNPLLLHSPVSDGRFIGKYSRREPSNFVGKALASMAGPRGWSSQDPSSPPTSFIATSQNEFNLFWIRTPVRHPRQTPIHPPHRWYTFLLSPTSTTTTDDITLIPHHYPHHHHRLPYPVLSLVVYPPVNEYETSHQV